MMAKVNDTEEKVTGYKVFGPDWKCRSFQYEVGKTYHVGYNIKLCKGGFHFCKNLADCFNYYRFDPRNKVAEIEAYGTIIQSKIDAKCCTNNITIVRELSWEEVLRLVNIGCHNTGYKNSGNKNSGNWNSGSKNSGNFNSGDFNSGSRNTGGGNSGNFNSGNKNSGSKNSGDYNFGGYNSGSRNAGGWNSGNHNSGNYNSGSRNTGGWNSGDWNSGDYNSGDWNAGRFHTGAFNTGENHTIMLFNKPSKWTFREWYLSRARQIMSYCPSENVTWVHYADMTTWEKGTHAAYEVTGGYLKHINYMDERQAWWDNLSETDRRTVMDLPNFDPEIFEACTGIKVNKPE